MLKCDAAPSFIVLSTSGHALRSIVKGYNITAAGSVSRRVSPSWGAPYADTLKGT